MPELAVLLRVVHTITAATTDYRNLLEVIAREAAQATGAGCTIRLRTQDGLRLTLGAAFDADADWLARFFELVGDREVPIDESPLLAQVFTGGEPVVVGDMDGLPAGQIHTGTMAAIRLLGIRAFAYFPLTVHGETIGLLALFRHGPDCAPLGQRHVDFAQTIADHAALSISNARLYDAAQRELATRRRVESTFRVSEEGRILAQGVVDTVRDPLLVLDGKLCVRSANLSYYECFRAEPGEVENRPLAEVRGGEWNDPTLITQLELTADDGTPIDGFEIEREFVGIGPRVMVLSARKIIGAGKAGMVLLVISDVTRRAEAERSLRDYARRLEERSRELESANHELDSFSYSVSHDLRAPLRAIDGFARILSEEHTGSLDGEGQRLLGVIRNNVRKMANLIDDLLAFSRLGRKPMSVAEIDMDGLVRQIASDVARVEPERQIEVRISALPPAVGDRTLVEQVWVNLISNAVKYTRGRQDAIISIDGAIEADQIVYRISDNGVGFDMRFANKLFGVFQRLHAASEFEGTGVGLALVRRIVVRHGGWISADGRPGAGATFEFALPRRERW
jgi:signal transduction histidine kinase